MIIPKENKKGRVLYFLSFCFQDPCLTPMHPAQPCQLSEVNRNRRRLPLRSKFHLSCNSNDKLRIVPGLLQPQSHHTTSNCSVMFGFTLISGLPVGAIKGAVDALTFVSSAWAAVARPSCLHCVFLIMLRTVISVISLYCLAFATPMLRMLFELRTLPFLFGLR